MPTTQTNVSNLSPREKAAILLISLGNNYATELFEHLTEKEINVITADVSNMRRVSHAVKEQVVKEFYEICLTQKLIGDGGIDYARGILEMAFGDDKADALILELTASLHPHAFEFLNKIDTKQIIETIRNEHPQTIAYIMLHIDANLAAPALMSLPPKLQSEVIDCIDTLDTASPEHIRQAEHILEQKLISLGFSNCETVGGIGTVVDIVSSLDHTTEKHILHSLDVYDVALADEIRQHLFSFEDIALLSGSAIKRLLREVSDTDLIIALTLAGKDIKKAIFANAPKRIQEMINDNMDVVVPVRVREVEEAQQRILNLLYKLDEKGEILVTRGDSAFYVA